MNDEKLLLCKTLRSFEVDVVDTRGFDFSQVCNGGVKLTEIDYHSMESKRIPGLYIVGELIDMNGKC